MHQHTPPYINTHRAMHASRRRRRVQARPPPATSTVVAHAASPAAQAVQASQAAAQARWIASTANAATVRHAPHEVATLAAAAPVEAAPAINGGDTAFVLVCAILVLSMTLPGLAFFYGGLTRVGSLNSMLLQHVAVASVASIVWIAFGCGSRLHLACSESEHMWLRVHASLELALFDGCTMYASGSSGSRPFLHASRMLGLRPCMTHRHDMT